MARVAGSWRSRVWIGAGLCAFALGAAGIGWAANGATDTNVLTACVDPAGGNVLMYSASGTCTSGQTTVQWDKQGPPGPPGAQGAPGVNASAPVVALSPKAYGHGFTLTTQITSPGSYVIDGSADVNIVPQHRPTFVASCRLLTGPPNGSATVISSWSLKFVYHYDHHKKTFWFVPASLAAPVDVNAGVDLARTDVPRDVFFTCVSLWSTWTHPTLTVEAATKSTFHPTVGPALPAKPVIGPSQLNHLLGNH